MNLDAFPQSLLKNSRIIAFKSNELLFQVDDKVECLFYIIKGETRALRYQYNGKAAVMMRSFQHEIFVPASMNLTHYPCAGITTMASQLLQIPKVNILEHLGSHPQFSRFYIDSIVKDLKRQCSHAERLRLKSVRDRIIHYITCESASGMDIHISYTLSKWAEELGIEAESLYRNLAEMQKEGIIIRNKRHFSLIPQ